MDISEFLKGRVILFNFISLAPDIVSDILLNFITLRCTNEWLTKPTSFLRWVLHILHSLEASYFCVALASHIPHEQSWIHFLSSPQEVLPTPDSPFLEIVTMLFWEFRIGNQDWRRKLLKLSPLLYQPLHSHHSHQLSMSYGHCPGTRQDLSRGYYVYYTG